MSKNASWRVGDAHPFAVDRTGNEHLHVPIVAGAPGNARIIHHG